MEELQKMLETEIGNEIAGLENLDLGSAEHSRAVADIVALSNARINSSKVDLEFENTIMQETKNSNDSRNSIARVVVDAAGVVLPLMFYGKWMKKGFDFEENGAITSFTFRNLISKFRPTRK